MKRKGNYIYFTTSVSDWSSHGLNENRINIKTGEITYKAETRKWEKSYDEDMEAMEKDAEYKKAIRVLKLIRYESKR